MLRRNLPWLRNELDPIENSSESPADGVMSKYFHSSGIKCDTKPLPPKHNSFLGFIYVSLNTTLFTLASVFVKKLSYIDPGQLALVRNVGVLVLCLPVAVYSVPEVTGPREFRTTLLLRGFLGGTALYFTLMAFRYLPLAEASIALATVPAVTTVIARVYLKEYCGRVQILCLVITLCGVLLSVRLPMLLSHRGDARFDSVYLGGLASAVGCVLFFSFSCVLTRKLKDIHFSVQLLYFGVIGTIESGVISFCTSPVDYPRCGWDQIFVMLIGAFGYIAHCALTLAFQVEAAGIVTVLVSSMDIVIAMAFQLAFFNDDIDAYNISGAFLVIVSVSALVFSKWLRLLPDDSKARKKFKYFLL